MTAQAAVVQHGGSLRILFHVFSMAGWGLFGAMLRDMAISGAAPRLSDVCGAVVDSAPQIAVHGPPHILCCLRRACCGGQEYMQLNKTPTVTLRQQCAAGCGAWALLMLCHSHVARCLP